MVAGSFRAFRLNFPDVQCWIICVLISRSASANSQVIIINIIIY